MDDPLILLFLLFLSLSCSLVDICKAAAHPCPKLHSNSETRWLIERHICWKHPSHARLEKQDTSWQKVRPCHASPRVSHEPRGFENLGEMSELCSLLRGNLDHLSPVVKAGDKMELWQACKLRKREKTFDYFITKSRTSRCNKQLQVKSSRPFRLSSLPLFFSLFSFNFLTSHCFHFSFLCIFSVSLSAFLNLLPTPSLSFLSSSKALSSLHQHLSFINHVY